MNTIRLVAVLGASLCLSCTDSTSNSDSNSGIEPEPADKRHVWSEQTDTLKRAKDAEKLIQDAAKSRAEQLDTPPK